MNKIDSLKNSVVSSPMQAMTVIGVVVICLSGFLHAFWYKAYQPDDAFIYLVYVKNFLNGNGLTFNGALVEGYSSVLWTLLVLAISWLGLDPLIAAKILGWCSYLVLALLMVWVLRSVSERSYTPLLAIVIYFSVPSVAMWASGAMETVLFSALIAGASFTYFYARIIRPSEQFYLLSGLLFGMVSLTRPEGFALIGSVIVFEAILFLHYRKWLLKGAIITISLWAVITAAMFIVRWVIYDRWFPTTVSAKTGNLSWQIKLGSNYISDFAIHHYVLIAAYLASIIYSVIFIRKSHPNQYFLICLLTILTVGYLTFNWLVGGDWMLGWRFIVPVVPFIVLSVGIIAGNLNPKIGIIATSVLVISLLMKTQGLHHQSIRQVESSKGDILMGKYIKSLDLPPSTKIAVIDAGAIPYYAGLPTIDMIGLNDPYLSTLRGGFLQKFDNNYVLSQKPKIIQFHTKYIDEKGNVAPTEAFRGALVLFYTKEFQRWYDRDTLSPIPHLFIRRDKPRSTTFLDTFFAANVSGEISNGVLRLKLKKTGDGIWVAQDEDRLQAGVVYMRIRATSGRELLFERYISIPHNMSMGDEVNFKIILPRLDNANYQLMACPVLLGVRELEPCLNGTGFHVAFLGGSALPGQGRYKFDDPRLGLIGWSGLERDHVWSIGNESEIKFKVANPETVRVVTLDIQSFGKQAVSVSFNGVNLYNGIVDGEKEIALNVYGLVRNTNLISLKLPDAKMPGNEDHRLLAVALKHISIE